MRVVAIYFGLILILPNSLWAMAKCGAELAKLHHELFEKISDDPLVGDADIGSILESFHETYHSKSIAEFVALANKAREAKIGEWFLESLPTEFLRASYCRRTLGKELLKAMGEPVDSDQFQFALLVLKDRDDEHPYGTLVQAFRELAKLRVSGANFDESMREWLSDKGVGVAKKAQVMSLYLGKRKYAELRLHIARGHKRRTDAEIGKFSTFFLFKKRLQEQFENRALIAHANPMSFEFRHIPIPEGGILFQLGSPAEEEGRHANENFREERIERSYEIAVTELTQLHWAAIVGQNEDIFEMIDQASFHRGENEILVERGDGFNQTGRAMPNKEKWIQPNHPIEHVCRGRTEEVIRRLNELDPKYIYRLPTEAEWEYAMRAGNRLAYGYAADPFELERYAQFASDRPVAVAQYLPNTFGLYDMLGNVEEWVADHHNVHEEGYNILHVPNGQVGVLRGGFWSSRAKSCRAAARSLRWAGYRGNMTGFRLVRFLR